MSAQNRAIFNHCQTVYNKMHELGHDEQEGRVYEGFTTKLFRDLGLGVPHYSQVLTELKRMGCIYQVKRGGGTAESIWLLIKPPTEEMFESLPDLTRNAVGGMKVQLRIEAELKTIKERLTRLEQANGLVHESH